jgi:hypothetical protein
MSARGTHPFRGFARFVCTRYDRRSLAALVVLATCGVVLGYGWRDLVDLRGEVDWLLAALWAWLGLSVTWNLSPRRDAVLLAVGLVGGGLIETWGTRTGVWSYFTHERPPLWIVPAWATSAVSMDRLATLVDRAGTALADSRAWRLDPRAVARLWPGLYATLLGSFVVAMTWFVWPAAGAAAVAIAVTTMVLVVASCRRPRDDTLAFVAGALLGLLIEYWGTSRRCWSYHTGQVPPPVAVFAHGFAAVAFGRAAGVVHRALDAAFGAPARQT